MPTTPMKVGEFILAMSVVDNVATVVVTQVMAGGRLCVIYSGVHPKGDSYARITPVFFHQSGG